jgi:hypothetical protein
MNEEIPDRRAQFCEWFQHKVHEDEEFVSKTVCSDVTTFMQNYSEWPELCVLGSGISTCPRLTVWCGPSHRYLSRPLFLRKNSWPCVPQHASDVNFICHSSALWEWDNLVSTKLRTTDHQDVRSYLDETLPGQWIGRRGSVEYAHRQTFTCGGPWSRKPPTLATLREKLKCRVLLATVPPALSRRTQKCLQSNGGHFEHLC